MYFTNHVVWWDREVPSLRVRHMASAVRLDRVSYSLVRVYLQSSLLNKQQYIFLFSHFKKEVFYNKQTNKQTKSQTIRRSRWNSASSSNSSSFSLFSILFWYAMSRYRIFSIWLTWFYKITTIILRNKGRRKRKRKRNMYEKERNALYRVAWLMYQHRALVRELNTLQIPCDSQWACQSCQRRPTWQDSAHRSDSMSLVAFDRLASPFHYPY